MTTDARTQPDSEPTTTETTVQVYRVYIKATPEAVWEAITTPEWTERFGYGGRGVYDLRPGGRYQGHASPEMKAYDPNTPDVVIDGEVVDADPPHRLVQTWRMLMDPTTAAEGFTRLTYEIVAIPTGSTRLTITHDLTGAPRLAQLVGGHLEDQGAGGGWAWVLSSLKTLLETGERI